MTNPSTFQRIFRVYSASALSKTTLSPDEPRDRLSHMFTTGVRIKRGGGSAKMHVADIFQSENDAEFRRALSCMHGRMRRKECRRRMFQMFSRCALISSFRATTFFLGKKLLDVFLLLA